jgi:phosphoglycolate phosphatase-like HAD superfamily hydrolase
MPWGMEKAEEFVRYHKAAGGVSRFVKVRHLVETILDEPGNESLIAQLLGEFGVAVKEGLLNAHLVPGVVEFLEQIPRDSLRFVVSGGLEEEVRDVLEDKGILDNFTAVCGSPRSKVEILTSLGEQYGLGAGIFFGDSAYDGDVAARFGLDFVFVAGVSEYPGGRSLFGARGCPVIEDFTELLPGLGTE